MNTLLLNPYILSAIGCLVSAAILYFKGKQSGLKQAQQENAEAMDRIETDLHKREAQNQNIETESEKNAETVRSSSGIPALIGLFNKLFNQKAPDSSSDKKTP